MIDHARIEKIADVVEKLAANLKLDSKRVNEEFNKYIKKIPNYNELTQSEKDKVYSNFWSAFLKKEKPIKDILDSYLDELIKNKNVIPAM